MTDIKAAAARLKAALDHPLSEREIDPADVDAVVHHVLALHADKGAEETARKILAWTDGLPPERTDLFHAITAALSAAAQKAREDGYVAALQGVVAELYTKKWISIKRSDPWDSAIDAVRAHFTAAIRERANG